MSTLALFGIDLFIFIEFRKGSEEGRSPMSPGLLHRRQILCHLSHQGKLMKLSNFIKTQFNVQDISNMFNSPSDSIPASPLLTSCITHSPPTPVKSIPSAFGRWQEERGYSKQIHQLCWPSQVPLHQSFHPHLDSASPLCYPIPNLSAPQPWPLPFLSLGFYICSFPYMHPIYPLSGGVSVSHFTVPDPRSPHTCTGTHSDQIFINLKETFQKHCWRIDLKAGRMNL